MLLPCYFIVFILTNYNKYAIINVLLFGKDFIMQEFIQNMTLWLQDKGISSEIIIFIISMIPILELRGGLIASSLLGVSLVKASAICILGNIVPIPFILLFIRQIFEWLKKVKGINKIIYKLEDTAMKKSDTIQKSAFVGLMLFVGIPLPGTGAWTGSLIASLLDVKMKISVPAILCGLIMATIIMDILSYGGLAYIISLFN